MMEMIIEPAQPSQLEKKANMQGNRCRGVGWPGFSIPPAVPRSR